LFYLKALRIDSYTFVALILIVLAVVLRIVLISLGWPSIDSDEGTMGIMALHIAYHGEYPIFFYGQGYMGSLEAYLAAIAFHIIGPSVLSLRLGVLLMFACFLASMYLLTSLLYTKKLALVTLVILCLGPSEILFHQLEAAGGYPETLLFGAVLLLYASWLAFSAHQNADHRKWRLFAYAGFGCMIGLSIWSDILILPFIIMSCLLILVFCYQEMRVTGILCLVLGFTLSILPTIVYNLTVPLNQGSFAFLGIIFTHDTTGHVISQPSLLQKIAGTLLVSLPLATGASTICPISPGDAWPLSARSSSYTLQCTAVHGLWGLGSIVLWTVAVILAVRYYWKLHPQFPAKPWSSEEKRHAAIRQFARLMLLASVGLALVIYLLSAPSALDPWPGSRYLVGLQIATPALIAPLWGTGSTIGNIKLQTTLAKIMMGLRYSLMMLIGITFLLGTINTFTLTPGAQAKAQQQATLVHDLVQMGATHIYTDYWTCDRVAFQSNEQIVCSVLDEQLQPGLNRYTPYQAIVSNAPHPAYVFPLASPQATAFATKAATSNEHYQRFTFDGYVAYLL
jgi:hypothetical protein